MFRIIIILDLLVKYSVIGSMFRILLDLLVKYSIIGSMFRILLDLLVKYNIAYNNKI